MKFRRAIEKRYPDVTVVSNSGPDDEGTTFDRLWQLNRRAGTDLVCRLRGGAGTDRSSLASLRLGDVPESPALSPALQRLRRRRSDLGLPAGDDAPLLIDPVTGAPVASAAVPLHLAKARVVRVGVEANTSMCRGMLRHRYQAEGIGESDGEIDEVEEP